MKTAPSEDLARDFADYLRYDCPSTEHVTAIQARDREMFEKVREACAMVAEREGVVSAIRALTFEEVMSDEDGS